MCWFVHVCDIRNRVDVSDGLDGQEIEDQLSGKCDESDLTDFDADFPFKKEPDDDDVKEAMIFHLLKRCLENPDIRFDAMNTC